MALYRPQDPQHLLGLLQNRYLDPRPVTYQGYPWKFDHIPKRPLWPWIHWPKYTIPSGAGHPKYTKGSRHERLDWDRLPGLRRGNTLHQKLKSSPTNSNKKRRWRNNLQKIYLSPPNITQICRGRRVGVKGAKLCHAKNCTSLRHPTPVPGCLLPFHE